MTDTWDIIEDEPYKKLSVEEMEKLRRDEEVIAQKINATPEPTDTRALLACILLNPTFFSRACSAKISASSFVDRKETTIWRAMEAVEDEPDLVSVCIELNRQGLLESVGGHLAISQLQNEVATTAQFPYWLERVRIAETKRRIVPLTAELAGSTTVEEASAIVGSLSHILESSVPVKPIGKGFRDFKLIADDHPSVLLGHKWLSRGEKAMVIGQTGVGKSVWCMQAAATWATGKSFFGIKPARPLRSLIIQAEDSDSDLADMVWSYIHRIKPAKQDDVYNLLDGVRVFYNDTERGEDFATFARQCLREFPDPDLIWINPVFAYIDGDINKTEDAGYFMRTLLGRLNPNHQWAYMCMHHTPKPPRGDNSESTKWSDIAYQYSGNAELVNPCRATISLNALEEHGQFEMVMGKRAGRAGIYQEVPTGAGYRLEPVSKVRLQYSTGRFSTADVGLFTDPITEHNVVFWEAADPVKATKDAPRQKSTAAILGNADLDKILSYFPDGKEHAAAIQNISRECGEKYFVTRQVFTAGFHELTRLERVFDNGDGKWYKPANQPNSNNGTENTVSDQDRKSNQPESDEAIW